MGEHSLNISLHIFNNSNILSHNINKISILRSNTTLNLGGVEILKVEENKKREEDLVEEGAKLYVITMDNKETFLKMVQVL